MRGITKAFYANIAHSGTPEGWKNVIKNYSEKACFILYFLLAQLYEGIQQISPDIQILSNGTILSKRMTTNFSMVQDECNPKAIRATFWLAGT